MFCDRCGVQVSNSAGYCPSCGKALGTIPLMPVESRIAGHVRLLGILWLAISAFRLLPGLFLIAMMRGPRMAFLPPDVPFFVHGILHFVGWAFIFFGGIGLLAGWGLLERQPWARTLTIVLGCLNLVDMPIGTALGVYTLWALLPSRSEEEYRRMSRVA